MELSIHILDWTPAYLTSFSKRCITMRIFFSDSLHCIYMSGHVIVNFTPQQLFNKFRTPRSVTTPPTMRWFDCTAPLAEWLLFLMFISYRVLSNIVFKCMLRFNWIVNPVNYGLSACLIRKGYPRLSNLICFKKLFGFITLNCRYIFRFQEWRINTRMTKLNSWPFYPLSHNASN